MIFDDIPKSEGGDSNMPNQKFDSVDKIQREPKYNSYDQYRYGGYMYLQNLLANALLRDKARSSTAYVSMIYAQSKSSVHNRDYFSETASRFWPFFIPFLFMMPLYRLIKFVVSDKETKIRETMKCLGMSDLCYWLSWLSYYTVINTLLCTAMTLILKPAFEFTQLSLVFLHLWIYGMTLFSLGVFISAFFINSGKAAKNGTFIFYASSFLFLWVAKDNVSESIKIASAFIPVLGVQLAGNNLFDYERSQIGLNFDNASDLHNNYRFSTCIWTNILSSLILGVLGLYLENVLPSCVGERKPIFFPFMPSYWRNSRNNQVDSEDINLLSEQSCKLESEERSIAYDEHSDTESKPENFEDISAHLVQESKVNNTLNILNLTKNYGENI
jgi:ATP-binding cassette subfamily A (ABC1) protein 12